MCVGVFVVCVEVFVVYVEVFVVYVVCVISIPNFTQANVK